MKSELHVVISFIQYSVVLYDAFQILWSKRLWLKQMHKGKDLLEFDVVMSYEKWFIWFNNCDLLTKIKDLKMTQML